jgi:hypothetical protein
MKSTLRFIGPIVLPLEKPRSKYSRRRVTEMSSWNISHWASCRVLPPKSFILSPIMQHCVKLTISTFLASLLLFLYARNGFYQFNKFCIRDICPITRKVCVNALHLGQFFIAILAFHFFYLSAQLVAARVCVLHALIFLFFDEICHFVI